MLGVGVGELCFKIGASCRSPNRGVASNDHDAHVTRLNSPFRLLIHTRSSMWRHCNDVINKQEYSTHRLRALHTADLRNISVQEHTSRPRHGTSHVLSFWKSDHRSRRHHYMGNVLHQITGDSPHEGTVVPSFDGVFVLSWLNIWPNSGMTGERRRFNIYVTSQ